jgi:hypothetical protein
MGVTFQNAPGAITTLFLSIIYEVWYQARVFVRLGGKKLAGTNTRLLQKLINYGQEIVVFATGPF